VLREILWPKRVEGTGNWRKLLREELLAENERIKDEIGEAFRKYRTKERYKDLAGKVEVNRPYARSRRGWKESRIGLKGIGFVWLKKRTSGGLCEHGNEYSVSTNFEKTSDQPKKYYFLKKNSAPWR
jgi:hypothetical protein